MHRLPLLLVLLPCLALAADVPPAAAIAAKVIRERAQELERGGQAVVAGELRALADQLAGGSVTLADAHLVVQIALAGQTAAVATPLTPEQRRAAEKAAASATALLDGDAPAPAPRKPPAAAPIDEKALGVLVATSVVLAEWYGEPKSLVVMIGAGKDQHITQGQRFLVKRGETTIATLSASQVKNNDTICIAIPGTLAQGQEIKPGDTVVSE